MCITKWKKPIWKGHILYDAQSVACWEGQNHGDSKKISGSQRLKKEWHWRSHTEDFGGSRTILTHTKRWIYPITYLSKPIKCTTARVSPNVNSGLWMLMMYQCRFINCTKRTTAEWVTDSGSGCAQLNASIYGNPLDFRLYFVWT